MLPSVKVKTSFGNAPTNPALKFCTPSPCENGANELPRYQVMVGTGLPEETQVMLTESPSCIVTVPFRLVVDGASAAKQSFIGS